MFAADLSELGKLKDRMFQSSADAEEAFYLTRNLQTEMAADPLFRAADPLGTAESDLEFISDSLLRMKESLYDLAKSVAEVAACSEAEE